MQETPRMHTYVACEIAMLQTKHMRATSFSTLSSNQAVQKLVVQIFYIQKYTSILLLIECSTNVTKSDHHKNYYK